MQIRSTCFHTCDVVQKTHDTKSRPIGFDNKPSENHSETRFYCCGRVPPEGLYRKRHGMFHCHNSKNVDSVKLATEAVEDGYLGIKKYVSPKIPFIEELPEELYQGRAIEVHGKLEKNASRFSINLTTGKDNSSDLALHFNPRFDRHVVIRNHRIKNKWGVEEIPSLQPFPFTLGRNFSVLIFVADEQFLIAINKVHFCAFAFRIRVEKIKALVVLGDISLNLVQHYDRTYYPPHIFKKTPFIIIPCLLKNEDHKCDFRRKVKSIKTGSKIDIHGRLKVLPRAFYVNLQKGIDQWPHPTIPFHMNLRFYEYGTHKNEREVIFNSWSNGSWGKEEVTTFAPFLPGSSFHLRIVCNEDSYTSFVDDKLLFNYIKRIDDDIDSVIIHGDFVVRKVIIR